MTGYAFVVRAHVGRFLVPFVIGLAVCTSPCSRTEAQVPSRPPSIEQRLALGTVAGLSGDRTPRGPRIIARGRGRLARARTAALRGRRGHARARPLGPGAVPPAPGRHRGRVASPPSQAPYAPTDHRYDERPVNDLLVSRSQTGAGRLRTDVSYRVARVNHPRGSVAGRGTTSAGRVCAPPEEAPSEIRARKTRRPGRPDPDRS